MTAPPLEPCAAVLGGVRRPKSGHLRSPRGGTVGAPPSEPTPADQAVTFGLPTRPPEQSASPADAQAGIVGDR